MKKIIISLVALLFTFSAFAQTEPNMISVNGSYKYTVEPEFTAKMMLSLNNIYYDAPNLSLPELKTTYINNLVKAGIPKNAITENDLGYAIMGYEKEGTILEFKTKSVEEMKTFIKVKALGVSKSETTMELVLTDEQMADYAKFAYDDAKEKAERIAKKIGRSLGKVIHISDTNRKKAVESIYYASNLGDREYLISVSFELL